MFCCCQRSLEDIISGLCIYGFFFFQCVCPRVSASVSEKNMGWEFVDEGWCRDGEKSGCTVVRVQL